MTLKVWATALIGWGLLGTTAIAAPNPDGVELLIVGAQPTQQLRLKPIVGSQQQNSLIWDWQSEVNVGGQITAVPLPSIQASIVTEVQKIDPNGDIHYALRYQNIGIKEDATSQPSKSTAKIAAVFKQSLESLAGMTATSVISPQGKTKSTKITWPNQPGKKLDKTQQGLLDKFSESVGSLSAPLPEFPIGIGARWQQTAPIVVNGITIQQQMIYELTDRRDNIATIQVSIEQSIPESSPGTAARGKTAFKSLKSKGQGKLVWNLNQPIPSTSSLQLKSEAEIQPIDADDKSSKTPPSAPIVVTSQINFQITSP